MTNISFTETRLAVIIGSVLLIILYTIIFGILRKKTISGKSEIYTGLLFSFFGTGICIIHWFITIEYVGPIGLGIGIFVSPVIASVSAIIFFLMGWSLHKIIYGIKLFLYKRSTDSFGCLKKFIILFLFCSFIVGVYINHFVPDDYHLSSVPELNFINGIRMLMVKTSADYWVGAYEVTQAQFLKVMGFNHSTHKDPNLPVHNVSSDEAIDFCKKLTELEIKNETLPHGYVYKLPTERQWRSFVADAKLTDSVFPIYGPIRSPQRVGSLSPNRLGLYDVRGNVAEFCRNYYGRTGGSRVIRGGSFNNSNKEYWLIDNRATLAGSNSLDVGFRVIIERAD